MESERIKQSENTVIESLNMINPLWVSSIFSQEVLLLQSKTIEMNGIGRVLLERSKRKGGRWFQNDLKRGTLA